jgi:GT2 family glycosyltransferase
VSLTDQTGQAAAASSPPIGIVIVNYASTELIQANLDEFRAAEFRVVLVDNFSSESERVSCRELAAQRNWHFVAMAGNQGFGAGVNAGVAAAADLGCECFLLLNPDAAVAPATVRRLHAHSVSDPMALISPRLVDPDGRLTFAGSRLSWTDGRIRGLRGSAISGARELEWLTAACLVVHRELWRRVGGFDESYFMYWEDVDFNYRCLRAGGHVVLRADLDAVHDQGGTQGMRRGRAKSGLYYYYNCRNRGLFGARHLSRRRLVRWLLATPAVTREVYLHGGRRQLLESPRLLGYAVRGGLVAMAVVSRALLAPRPGVRPAPAPESP